MPFAWTAISLREILKDIEQETNLSTHSNTLPANVDLSTSSGKASSLGKRNKEKKIEIFLFISLILIYLERRNLGTVGLRNAYESFRRSRDESLTRNNSKRNDERQSSVTSPTLNSTSNNFNFTSGSDEFFHVLANFDRPIVINLKNIYKQVNEFFFKKFSNGKKQI